MTSPVVTRDPTADPRTRRAFDQLNEILKTICYVLTTSVTQTGNTAATETDLFSYSLPANELGLSDSISFEVCGTIAGTVATNKRIKVKFGATTVYDSGNLAITSATKWSLRGTITRSTATVQKCEATLATSSSVLRADVGYTTATETLSSAVSLSVTGNGTNASDVVGERFKVTKVPA